MKMGCKTFWSLLINKNIYRPPNPLTDLGGELFEGVFKLSQPEKKPLKIVYKNSRNPLTFPPPPNNPLQSGFSTKK
ncbi:MAG: hypothetical protein DRR19_13580 [Candidatus Parabeggiatoa sp. nov. 1]|nr:MAG: hypothetical protein DRR19_13580 [Gammaproteobacteria bacterium]